MTWVLVAVGGAVGAVVRDLAARRLGPVAGIDLVNRVGSVLLGVVVAAVEVDVLGPDALALVGVGLAGGMTTFSTWMVQVVGAREGIAWSRLVRETVLGLVLASVALASTTAILA